MGRSTFHEAVDRSPELRKKAIHLMAAFHDSGIQHDRLRMHHPSLRSRDRRLVRSWNQIQNLWVHTRGPRHTHLRDGGFSFH